MNSAHERVSMHGTRERLLELQAASIGLPLKKMYLPETPSMEEYSALMAQFLSERKREGIEEVIFGDIFLEDLKRYREDEMKKAGMRGVFPIWKKDTHTLPYEFLRAGFRAVVICVQGSLLDKSFAGRLYDESFLKDLPEGVDPCGENGEFHTFCFDGPIFSEPVRFEPGEVITKTYEYKVDPSLNSDFHFADLVIPEFVPA